MECPAENILVDFVDHRLGAEAAGRVSAHLDACGPCLSLVAEIARDLPLRASVPGLATTMEMSALEAAPPSPTAGFHPPEVLGEYRILRRLGSGAMGHVYVAHDTLLDRKVAVKFVAAHNPDEETRARMLVEARAIARLSHPNVVVIYRVGEVDGRPYLVSEFVRGRSLDKLPLPIDWRLALDIAVGMARALRAAHERGVLHRDIKPANVMLRDDGEVKLLDFGLAKLMEARLRASQAPRGSGALDEAPGLAPGPPSNTSPAAEPSLATASPALTRSGARVGTPLYFAPEVWDGVPATPASDIYAFGAVLYELCAGHAVFPGRTLAELRAQVVAGDVVPLARAAPGVEPRFAAVIERCLRLRPEQRFASAKELCDALLPLEGLRRAPAADAATPPARRSRRRAAIAALATVPVLLLAAGGMQWMRSKPGVTATFPFTPPPPQSPPALTVPLLTNVSLPAVTPAAVVKPPAPVVAPPRPEPVKRASGSPPRKTTSHGRSNEESNRDPGPAHPPRKVEPKQPEFGPGSVDAF